MCNLVYTRFRQRAKLELKVRWFVFTNIRYEVMNPFPINLFQNQWRQSMKKLKYFIFFSSFSVGTDNCSDNLLQCMILVENFVSQIIYIKMFSIKSKIKFFELKTTDQTGWFITNLKIQWFITFFVWKLKPWNLYEL